MGCCISAMVLISTGVCAQSADRSVNVTVVSEDQLLFINAVDRDRADVVSEMLKKGVSPNLICKNNEPALVRALRMDSRRVAEVLIQAPGINLDEETEYGENAVMLAAFAGNLRLVRQLVERGARINKVVGWTALHYAATEGHNDIVVYLLGEGANVNTRTENGVSALYMAARKPSREVVMTLLRAGAYRDVCNDKGQSPADAARAAGDAQLADFLKTERCVEPRPGVSFKQNSPDMVQ